MKENTKRLLVWLYPALDQPRFVKKTETIWLLENISDSGFQSLLYLMEKKSYIESQLINGTRQYSLTQYGKKSIEAEFPALSNERWHWQGEWTTIVCLSAPTSDKNFRYLRELMVSHYLIGLTRAVFLYPGVLLPPSLQSALETLYPNAVAVLETPKWLWGDERTVIGQKTQLYAHMSVYSGISTEIDRLTTHFESTKNSEDQPKIEITSLFNRYYSTLQSDYGLGKRYFPQVDFARELLARLQLFG